MTTTIDSSVWWKVESDIDQTADDIDGSIGDALLSNHAKMYTSDPMRNDNTCLMFDFLEVRIANTLDDLI